MAIDPVLTSTVTLQTGPRAQAESMSREQGAERLGELVHTMEQVAAALDTPGRSHSERTVLRGRFNDLQRQVNRLDGIVAGEGLESSGQERVAHSTTSSTAVTTATQTTGNDAPVAPADSATEPANTAAGDTDQLDVVA